jgi:transposase
MPAMSLTPEQQAELRRAALVARADTMHRGHGWSTGKRGRNATEALVDLVRERWGVEIGVRGMQKLLGRLGLAYVRLNQGGHWREAGDGR